MRGSTPGETGRVVPPAGVSHWWPTPARPGDHFTAGELRRSAEVHQPVRSIRLALVVARLTALVAGAVVVAVGPLASLVEAPLAVRSLIGSGLVVAAIRLPEAAARRRLARRDDVVAVDGVGTATGTAVGLAVSTITLALVAAPLLGWLADPGRGWVVAVGAVALVVAVAVVTVTAQVRRVDDVAVPGAWVELVDRSGAVGRVRFGSLPDQGHPGPMPINACALGFGRHRLVLVPTSLGAGPGPAERAVPGPTAEFVIAHELAHLARRHPEIQVALTGLAVATSVGLVAALAPGGRPWSIIGLAADDPLALPLAALVGAVGWLAARVPLAWVLRSLERRADGAAAELVGVPERSALRLLHLDAGAELDPPAWSRLVAAHPSPVERLEYLGRRRSG